MPKDIRKQKVEGKSWYSIKNFNKGNYVEVYIYDEIGYWGVTAKEFITDLNKITADQINLRIHSVGGEVFDALAIYNSLKRIDKRVDVYIDGLAASAASFIALAGDKIYMAENAYFMIHNAMTIAMGNSKDLRETADFLDNVSGTIRNIYATKTSLPEDQISTLMDEETWFTGKEALESGFVDELTEAKEITNRFDLSVFNKVPTNAKLDLCEKFGFCGIEDSVNNAENEHENEHNQEEINSSDEMETSEATAIAETNKRKIQFYEKL